MDPISLGLGLGSAVLGLFSKNKPAEYSARVDKDTNSKWLALLQNLKGRQAMAARNNVGQNAVGQGMGLFGQAMGLGAPTQQMPFGGGQYQQPAPQQPLFDPNQRRVLG